MSIDSESLKLTMRTWVSGVTVVTAVSGGRRAGVTASSFTSVSLEPPLILVSLQEYIETYKLILESEQFAVSILSSGQSHLSRQFAGQLKVPEGEDRFYGVELRTAVTGSPILADAIGWLDCRLTNVYEGGVSRIVMGEVLATGQQIGVQPLVYHNRDYFQLLPEDENIP